MEQNVTKRKTVRYKIWGALGGGFGGTANTTPETIEFLDLGDKAKNDEFAELQAYESALEEYEHHAGMQGLRSLSDIMDEEGVDEATAEDIYNEERESWLDYRCEELISK